MIPWSSCGSLCEMIPWSSCGSLFERIHAQTFGFQGLSLLSPIHLYASSFLLDWWNFHIYWAFVDCLISKVGLSYELGYLDHVASMVHMAPDGCVHCMILGFLISFLIGYRDGLTVGKEASAQDSFVVGFKQSVLVGYKWGHVCGISSALALLPNHLREKKVREPETCEKFQKLYDSVSSISSKDIQKIFYDDITGGRPDNPHNHVMDNTNNPTIPDNISGCKQLGRFSMQLESLLDECPSIEVHSAAERDVAV